MLPHGLTPADVDRHVAEYVGHSHGVPVFVRRAITVTKAEGESLLDAMRRAIERARYEGLDSYVLLDEDQLRELRPRVEEICGAMQFPMPPRGRDR